MQAEEPNCLVIGRSRHSALPVAPSVAAHKLKFSQGASTSSSSATAVIQFPSIRNLRDGAGMG